LPVAARVVESYGEEFVVTSTYEGNHGAGSLHYDNNAYDVRNPRKNKPVIVLEIKEKLGKDYDVINELSHIHIEYDPK